MWCIFLFTWLLVMQLCLEFRRTCFNCCSQWWTLLPGWCSCHQSTTQSLHFSTNCIGWRLRSESSSNSLSWHFSLTSSSGLRTSRLEVVFAQRHHRHWSSVVNVCRLSATELSWSPLLLCLDQTTAPRHVLTEFSAVVWRLIFSAVPVLTSVIPVKWHVI